MVEQVSTPTTLACSQCRRTFAQSDLVQLAGNWVCGDCKPAYLSRVVAGSAASANPRWRYGGFWIRWAALFIDNILMQVLRVPLSLLIVGTYVSSFQTVTMVLTGRMLTLSAITLLIALIYEVSLIHYYGATLGKMAAGVKVVRSDGSGISWGISIARYFMKFVSAIILLIGYIMAGFDSEKRALHDRVCDTRVIYKRSAA